MIPNYGRQASIGSKASASASTKAINVAVGRNTAAITDRQITHVPRPNGITRSGIHPGSRAGLNDQKIVRLNHNNAGYLNPRHQLARRGIGKPKLAQSSTLAPRVSFPKPKPKLSDNRLLKSENSSISRLSRIMN